MCFLLNIILLCDCAHLVVVCSCCCCHHKCIPRSVIAVILATSRGEAPSDDDDNNDYTGRALSSGGGHWRPAVTMAATHLPTHPLAERLEHQPRHNVCFVLVVPTRLRCLCCHRHPPPKMPLPKLAERDLQEITRILPAAPSSSSFAMPLPLSPSRSSRPMNNAPMSIAGIDIVAIGELQAAAAAATVALPILAGNVGKCVCRLHPSNDRHFCLSPTCRKCCPDTSATFCYVGHFFGCRHRVGETCCRHTFLHARRNQ
jgi:hypothetical protein